MVIDDDIELEKGIEAYEPLREFEDLEPKSGGDGELLPLSPPR